MARETLRKLKSSPNLVHADVQRNSSGTVQLTQTTQTTGNTQTGTTTNTVNVTTISSPSPVAFSSATLQVSGGGGGNTATATLLRDGSSIATTSGTGAATSSISNTLTTPAQGPQYSVQIQSNGGTATWSLTLSREQRWA